MSAKHKPYDFNRMFEGMGENLAFKASTRPNPNHFILDDMQREFDKGVKMIATERAEALKRKAEKQAEYDNWLRQTGN